MSDGASQGEDMAREAEAIMHNQTVFKWIARHLIRSIPPLVYR